MNNVINVPADKWKTLIHLRGRMNYYKTRPNIYRAFNTLYSGELSNLKIAS